MRILYDGNIYTLQKTGGINRYFANLISRLPQDTTPVLTTCRRPNLSSPQHPNLDVRYFPRPELAKGRRIPYWLGKQYFQSIATGQHIDLFHPTYYSLLNHQTIDAYHFPLVITVHDLIHERFDPQHPHIADKRQAIAAAQAILCVSENTKQDLLERYGVSEDKITVTYLASEIDASLSHGTEPIPPQPYLLYVGGRNQYKNFDGLLTAFSKVISIDSEVQLCVVGAPFNTDEQKRLADLNLSDRLHHYSYVDDTHLAKLYRCSLAFVYPSFYEGFGIPPLEAMACGTAVVAAHTSSLPEVVGDAGILFDPTAPLELADILLHLLQHPIERDRLIAKGTERAKQFSWDKTAAQTFAVYQSVC